MFSPYYALARRFGPAEPRNHVSFNIALYGESHRRWAMTERSEDALSASPDRFQVGPSSAVWEDGKLILEVDEVAVPAPRRVRGRIVLHPQAVTDRCYTLDPNARHRWWPIAPLSRVEVDLPRPGLKWSGEGYMDSNEGSEPLEAGFKEWSWSRAHLGQGANQRAAMLYDPMFKDGSRHSLSVTIKPDGSAEEFEPPPLVDLPKTLWRVGRETRADIGAEPCIVSTLEDAPFYSRSILSTRLLGEDVTAMHEGLDLGRFASPVVQCMLPFRMPRRRR